jgi:hypothetical protein
MNTSSSSGSLTTGGDVEIELILEKLEMSAYKNSGEYTVKDAKAAINAEIQKQVQMACVELMGLVLTETGGEFTISNKTLVEFNKHQAVEIEDDPVTQKRIYRLKPLRHQGREE